MTGTITNNMRRMRQQPQPPKDYRCRDCAHSYDWCSPALDGHMICCRCKLDQKTEYGKWCKLLKDRACEHFSLKRQ